MKKIVEKLKVLNKTISAMESCTGGGLVNAITNIEGASEVLKYSAITYSNEFKIKMGVSREVIDKYSVYSIETAMEMSKNISKFTDSDYGIGITGKLNKVDDANPFGKDNVVYISIYDRSNDKFNNYIVEVKRRTRKENKQQIIDYVEEILEKIIK